MLMDLPRPLVAGERVHAARCASRTPAQVDVRSRWPAHRTPRRRRRTDPTRTRQGRRRDRPAPALPVHRLHDEEIERLLATGERRQELTALFGDKAYRELSRARTTSRRTARRAAVRASTCCRV